MADSIASLFVELGVDNKDLIAGFDDAESRIGGLEKSFNRMSGFINGTFAAVGGAALGAFASVGVGAFNVSKDVDTAVGAMASSLGLLPEEAAKFDDVIKQVYGNNFGNGIDDVGEAVTAVVKQFGLAADDPALPKMTENAFRLRDAYGVDVADSLSAVKTLTDNFGISSQEAFDLIASGYQTGLDRSGDFLDTVNEYSTQFSNAGADVTGFFNLLQSGLGGGMLGTDKAADAFKEYNVRILDGSATTASALDAIGINSTEFLGKLASGQMTVAESFTIVNDHLGKVGDKAVQYQAGVGLLGTQFEDLGVSAVLGMTMTSGAFDSVSGAIDKVDAQYNTLDQVSTGLWRGLTVAISPVSDAILDVANAAMPSVITAFNDFSASIAPVADYLAAVVTEGTLFNSKFSALPAPIQDVITSVTDFISKVQEVTKPITDFIAKNVEWKDVLIVIGGAITAAVIPALWGLATALAGPITLFAALVGGVALARNAWESDWLGIRTAAEGAIDYLTDAFAPLTTAIREFGTDALGEIVAWATGNDTEFTATKKIWEGAKESFGTVFTDMGNKLAEWGGIAWEWFKEKFPGAAEALTDAFDSIKGKFEKLWEVVKPLIDKAVEVFNSFVEDWGVGSENLSGALATAQGILDGVWTIMITAAETSIGLMIDAVTLIIQLLSGDFEGAWTTAQTMVTDVVNGLSTIVTTAFDTVATALGFNIDDVKDWYDSTVKNVSDWWENFRTYIASKDWQNYYRTLLNFFDKTGITNWYNDTTGKIKDWWETFKKYVVDKDWLQYGRDVTQGLWDGMTEIWNGLSDWWNRVTGSLSKTFTVTNKIKSPSKLFEEHGINIGKGLINGLEKMMPLANAAVSGLATTDYAYAGGYSPSSTQSQGNPNARMEALLVQLITELRNKHLTANVTVQGGGEDFSRLAGYTAALRGY